MNYTIRQAVAGNRPAHPELVPVIGRKLSGIWLIGRCVFMAFDDGYVINAELAPGMAGFERGLKIMVGETNPGVDWHAELADLGEPPEPIRQLIGQPFRGLDIDVFQFGPTLGIQLNSRGLLLVRAPEVQ